jgi:hypothetical protein
MLWAVTSLGHPATSYWRMVSYARVSFGQNLGVSGSPAPGIVLTLALRIRILGNGCIGRPSLVSAGMLNLSIMRSSTPGVGSGVIDRFRLMSLQSRARIRSWDPLTSDLLYNNNTFTWSGPSGVGGYAVKARVARLGQAPEQATHERCDGCYAVPLNSAEFAGGKKPPRRKRLGTQVLGG